MGFLRTTSVEQMPRKFDDNRAILNARIAQFDTTKHPLLGIRSAARRDTFVSQIVSSLRRIEYIRAIESRPIDPARIDPNSDIFDPLKAAIILRNQGQRDEAIWLVFLATHFGKHKDDGWKLTKDIYSAFGTRAPWTWENVLISPDAFRDWTEKLLPPLLDDGVLRRFSNHRKYESKNDIGTVLLSYCTLVSSYGQHWDWIQQAHVSVGQNPTEVFDYMFKDMKRVQRFGRLGIFDFLTMLGKLGLAPIHPGFVYLKGATGPLQGARLLIDNNPKSKSNPEKLESILSQLDNELKIGKQVLEDAMCNWQKSPDEYVYFRG